jgi:PAS domain S-box-containing protein
MLNFEKTKDLTCDMNTLKYLNVFEQSPIAIELYDSNGFLFDANQACRNLFGVENNEELKGFNLFADPNLSENVKSDLKQGKAIRHEFVFDFDLVRERELYKTSRSGCCYLEAFISPITNGSTSPEGFTVYVMEITNRKKVEIRLEEQSQELKNLNSTKDKFFSIIAHDLKNPFSAIIGFTDLMLKNFSSLDDNTLLQGLNTIESAAKHAFKLLENLLVWTRNQTGRIKFEPEILDLNVRIAEAVRISENSAELKQISLAICFRKKYQVFADKDMVDTILRNLVSNAIKYSRLGGKVKITANAAGNYIEVTIADNGVGIAAERLTEIFEIDKRTNTPGTANEMGTGLGLILCRDLLNKQGGYIRVESTQGAGSQFTIGLPMSTKK